MLKRDMMLRDMLERDMTLRDMVNVKGILFLVSLVFKCHTQCAQQPTDPV
jgi:hypothetical protein